MKAATALVAAWFLATPAVVTGNDAASDERCPRDEQSTIETPVTYRGPCVEILTWDASLVVERQVIERHAAGHAPLEKDEPHPTLSASRAKRLLDLADQKPQIGCNQVRADHLGDEIYYLSYLLERQLAVVSKTGATAPTGTIWRRDIIGICGDSGFGANIRSYGVPGEPAFLVLLMAIT